MSVAGDDWKYREETKCRPARPCRSCEQCTPFVGDLAVVVFLCCSCGTRMSTEGDGECLTCTLACEESEAA